MILPAWVLLIPLALFILVLCYLTKKACDDIKYCIKHTVRNRTRKDREFEEMKRDIERLSK